VAVIVCIRKIDRVSSILNNQGDWENFISAEDLKIFVEDTKHFFSYQVDVKMGHEAVAKLDELYDGLVRQYGEFIPLLSLKKYLMRLDMNYSRELLDKLHSNNKAHGRER
jgi:hypothetical protein